MSKNNSILNSANESKRDFSLNSTINSDSRFAHNDNKSQRRINSLENFDKINLNQMNFHNIDSNANR